MTEEESFALLRARIASVWELLLLLERSPTRQWTYQELVRELRASTSVVSLAANSLSARGFAAEPARGLVQFHAADVEKSAFANSLQSLYARRPISVIKEIMKSPNARLKTFSDAFRLRD